MIYGYARVSTDNKRSALHRDVAVSFVAFVNIKETAEWCNALRVDLNLAHESGSLAFVPQTPIFTKISTASAKP